MVVKNAPVEQEITFSMRMNSKGFQSTILNALQDPGRAARFTAAITSAVSNQPDLQECDATTILSAALLGESLNLSPSPQLGQYYLVPFKDNKNKRKTATFVLGYKGYVQLALRSGCYKRLNVLEIKDGELVSYNPLTEELVLDIIDDDAVRSSKKTIGYAASFEYLNGFVKTIYWSREKMESYALKYSKAYAADKRDGNAWTFWSTDFDGMAKKTMLRQLISKWGIMSTELETALRNDDSIVNNDNGYFEPETPAEAIEGTFEEVEASPAKVKKVSINEI